VTAHFRNVAYEKIRFYTLDAISQHGLDLPTLLLDTAAFWITPPESLMATVREAGLDPHNGLRAIGYATRMALPLFITCDTADLSHTVGSANTPWHTVFVYERHPHGLGFTERAYERLHEILPAVRDIVRSCPCARGCPCCVGKPLRQFTTWNVERGEGSIPSKAAALAILEGLLGDTTRLESPDTVSPAFTEAGRRTRLERELRRRLEAPRTPTMHHPIAPSPPTGIPESEPPAALRMADSEVRRQRREEMTRELRRRLSDLRRDAPEPAIARAPSAEPGPVATDPLGQVVIGSDIAARARARRAARSDAEAASNEGTQDNGENAAGR
jgi:hypothetical protein